VLDEPFDTLDQDGIHIVNGLIEAHLARQGSVILTSHLPLSMIGVNISTLDLDNTPDLSNTLDLDEVTA
jgi:ABC-type transport system involved in cytochrome c biogenesis ATPase subunit